MLDYVSKDEELLKAIDKELNIRSAVILVAIVHLSPSKEGEVDTAKERAGRGSQLPRRDLFH